MFDYIAQTGRLSHKIARYYFKQLISAMAEMESVGMSHRDLKPENILLDSNANLKIADFGFSSLRPINTTYKGTRGYMAPEIFENHQEGYNGTKADIFAAATILFIMIARHPPFAEAVPSDPHYKLIYA